MIERRSILVCEDDPVQLAILSAALGQAGYDTVTARSPGEALEKVKARPADAVVADVRLQDGDAFDLLGEMRREGYDAPMIMVSGYADSRTRGRALSEGARGLLEKPVDLPALVRVVRRMVERPAAPLTASVKVLVVEADDQERRHLSAIVEGAGFRAVGVGDTGQALDLVKKSALPFDFAVVDLRTSGSAAVKMLLDADPGIYGVMLAGQLGRESVKAAYRAGADTLLRDTSHLAGLLAGTLRAAAGKRAQADRERRRADEPWLRRTCRHARVALRQRSARIQLGVMAASVLVGFVVAATMGWSIREGERMELKIDRALERMEARPLSWPAERPTARPQAEPSWTAPARSQGPAAY